LRDVLQAVTPKAPPTGVSSPGDPHRPRVWRRGRHRASSLGEEDDRRNAFLTLSCATYWRERCELLPISPETVLTIRARVGPGGSGVAQTPRRARDRSRLPLMSVTRRPALSSQKLGC